MDGTAKRSRNRDWINKVKALKGKQPDEDAEEADGPPLTRVELYYWEIFVEANAQRMTEKGGSPHPLSMSDLKAAADLFTIDKRDYSEFRYVMLALDREYVKLVRDEIVARNERDARRRRNKRDRGG